MKNISKLSSKCKDFLIETADKLAVSTGFIRRRRKLTGQTFTQALIMGDISDGNL